MAKIQSLGDYWSQFVALQNRMGDEFKRDVLGVYKNLLKTGNTKQVKKKLENLKTGPAAPYNDMSSIPEEPRKNSVNTTRCSQRTAAKKAVEKTSLQLKQTMKEKLRNPDVGSKRQKNQNSDEAGSSSAKRKLNISNISAVSSDQKESEQVPESNSGAQLASCFVLLNRCDKLIQENGSSNANNQLDSPKNTEKNELNTDRQLKSPQISNSLKEAKLSSIKDCIGQKDNDKDSSFDLFVQSTTSELEKNRDPSNSKKTASPAVQSCSKDNSERLSVGHISSPKLSLEILEPVPNSTESVECVNADSVVVDCAGKSSFVCLREETVPVVTDSLVTVQDESKKADNSTFIAPTSVRPTRNRTKNQKYNDFSCSYSVSSNKNALPDEGNTTGKTDSECNESTNKSTSSKRGKKRKSEDDGNIKSVKSLKLVKQSDIQQHSSNNSNGCSDVSSKSGKSTLSNNLKPEDNSNQNDDANDLSSVATVRTRTRTIVKPTVKNPVVIDSNGLVNPSAEQEKVTKVTNIPIIRVSPPLQTPPVPVQRMTRTRTREMNNKPNLEKNDITVNNVVMKVTSDISGKENKIMNQFRQIMTSEKKLKTTPLATNNTIFSPSLGKSISMMKPTPLKLDSASKKNDGSSSIAEAQKKKLEIFKARSEASRRKRQEKEQRMLANKLVVEKEKHEKLMRLQKEGEERERLLAESKKVKEEQLLQKKQNAEIMLKEAEERRLKEEEIKQARLKKQEEEKKKQAEQRMKQAEEAKKLHEMRLAQEAKEKEARLKDAEKLKNTKLKQKMANDNSYELTPARDECLPMPPKSANDYGIPDNSDDSTDDEKQPKKIVPKWATKNARSSKVIIQSCIHKDLLASYFPLVNGGLNSSLFTNDLRHRQRNSSAVWSTPDTTLRNR